MCTRALRGASRAEAEVGSRFCASSFLSRPEWDDLESWREQRGWDMNGAMADITASLDPDTLELTLTAKGDVKALPPFKGIDSDFFGKPVSGDRVAGPFADLMTLSGPLHVDPR